jgi:hypothetical protein
MEWYYWMIIALLGSMALGIFYAEIEYWLEKNDWI